MRYESIKVNKSVACRIALKPDNREHNHCMFVKQIYLVPEHIKALCILHTYNKICIRVSNA